MKSRYCYIACGIIILLCSSFYYAVSGDKNPGTALFLIVENGKWGYIDKTGKQQIAPVYNAAQDFSDGLAAVRQDGLYGYINTNGELVIPSQYDYAEPFSYGTARVYKSGKPFVIDRAGKILFDHDFSSIGSFNSAGYTFARKDPGAYCLINRKGKQLTGTDFRETGPFRDGLAVVTKDTKSKAWLDRRPGVIDSTGKLIVPFGKYAEIYHYSEGRAIARELNEKDNKAVYVCLDKKGNTVYSVPRTKWRPLAYDAEYHDGLMVVNVYRKNPDLLKKGWVYDNEYKGVVDLQGTIICGDSAWKDITPFSHGRAFVEVGNRQLILINNVGAHVSSEVFSAVYGSRTNGYTDVFEDGKALVLGKDGWKFIDVNGKELARQPKRTIYDRDVHRDHDNVILGDEGVTLWIPGDTALARKWYAQADLWTMNDALIEVQFWNEDDTRTWGYVNHNGEEVWRFARPGVTAHKMLNIDFMNRGYFLASSPRDSTLDGYAGWGSSENSFEVNHKLNISYAKGKLQIVIDTAQYEEWFSGIAGYAVYVVNDTKSKCFFEAQDSRISMVVQALDADGQWKDIEHLPNSWCGNSYHTLYLNPQTHWKFVMPVYEGSIQTRLRTKLYYQSSYEQKEEEFLYSNEISGSVNPAQFWRKRDYFPQGIMDPYNE